MSECVWRGSGQAVIGLWPDVLATTGPSSAVLHRIRRLLTRTWAFWRANCKLIFMAEILLAHGFFEAGLSRSECLMLGSYTSGPNGAFLAHLRESAPLKDRVDWMAVDRTIAAGRDHYHDLWESGALPAASWPTLSPPSTICRASAPRRSNSARAVQRAVVAVPARSMDFSLRGQRQGRRSRSATRPATRRSARSWWRSASRRRCASRHSTNSP